MGGEEQFSLRLLVNICTVKIYMLICTVVASVFPNALINALMKLQMIVLWTYSGLE